jgi:hypothetical protein
VSLFQALLSPSSTILSGDLAGLARLLLSELFWLEPVSDCFSQQFQQRFAPC